MEGWGAAVAVHCIAEDDCNGRKTEDCVVVGLSSKADLDVDDNDDVDDDNVADDDETNDDDERF